MFVLDVIYSNKILKLFPWDMIMSTNSKQIVRWKKVEIGSLKHSTFQHINILNNFLHFPAGSVIGFISALKAKTIDIGVVDSLKLQLQILL